MAGTEALKSPNLHLSKTLSTELSLTTKWLLSDERVRTDRTGMHLILNHVTELQEVGDTNGSLLVERLTRLTIINSRRAEVRQTGLLCPLTQVFKLSTVEDWSSELHTEFLTCSTKNSLEDLSQIHTRRHTHRVQHQVDRATVSQERHILLTHNLRDNTLVTVTTGKLITNLDLTLLCDIDFGHLQDTGRQLITNGNGELATVLLSSKLLVLADIVHDQLLDESVDVLIIGPTVALDAIILEVLKCWHCELAALGENLRLGIVFHALASLAVGERHQLVNEHVLQLVALCLILLIDLLKLDLILFLRLTRLLCTLEEFFVDDNTTQRRIGLE